MSDIPELPNLCFLPLEALIFHEWHDPQRTPPLIERIRESGLFRNPPVVVPLSDVSRRYMVLDGANRITALKEMGFPDVLVQVTTADDPGLKLENWNHVVWGLPPVDFFRGFWDISGLNLVGTEDSSFAPDLMGDCGLTLLEIPGLGFFIACTQARELVKRVALLNAIVDSYKERARLDRTGHRHIEPITSLYPNLSGLVIFPQFQIEEVLRLAGEGYLLPTGITRFTISPRALHVNYPLYELAAPKPLDVKNAELQDWIQHRIAQKGVRYYAEATFLYDE
jgi:L-serine kinase (ATP) / ParB family transcriptional regulator, heme-responsive regulator